METANDVISFGSCCTIGSTKWSKVDVFYRAKNILFLIKTNKSVEGLFLGPKRTYDDFRKQILPDLLPLFDSLREFCLSLGTNVVEDVRAHRIVFGKSLSFRWFADLEPDQQTIIVKIQRDRKEPFRIASIKPNENPDELKKQILDAYNTIH
jgi:hypothetical protein